MKNNAPVLGPYEVTGPFDRKPYAQQLELHRPGRFGVVSGNIITHAIALVIGFIVGAVFVGFIQR